MEDFCLNKDQLLKQYIYQVGILLLFAASSHLSTNVSMPSLQKSSPRSDIEEVFKSDFDFLFIFEGIAPHVLLRSGKDGNMKVQGPENTADTEELEVGL